MIQSFSSWSLIISLGGAIYFAMWMLYQDSLQIQAKQLKDMEEENNGL